MSTPPDTPPSPRTQVRRVADLGRYDAQTVRSIIDSAWHCHIAFADEDGVHCIPMACWRQDDLLYIHGSNGGRLLKALADGIQVCVAITHLDGLVLARSAFAHAMNYRSVVIYSPCARVANEDKATVLDYFMKRIAPGRQLEVRAPNQKELAATLILQLSISEAAAKIREGAPTDYEEDLQQAVWAGVLPLRMEHLPAVRDPQCQMDPPAYVQDWAGRSI